MKPETHDIAVEVGKASPAVFGAWFANANPNDLAGFAVAIVTLIYIVVQCGYLVRKWMREEREWVRKMRRPKDSQSSTLQ